MASSTTSIPDYMSHPSRGAWIEIRDLPIFKDQLDVAPLTGCVD